MKTNDFSDPRLREAVLGQVKKRRPRIKGLPVRKTIEYRIIQLKKELGYDPKTPQYQIMMFGEWRNMSLEDYKQAKSAGMNVRIL